MPSRAANDPSVFVITEKVPTMDFSWLKALNSALSFKTLLRHYAKHAPKDGGRCEIGMPTQLL